MSTTIIVVIFFLLVLASIGVIGFIQMRERARIERQRKLTQLENTHLRMRRLIAELPSQYLTQELKILLIDRAIEVLQELQILKHDPARDALLAEDRASRENILKGRDKVPPSRIESPARAKEVQHLLEALFHFIETQQHARKLDGKLARNYLKYVLYLIHRTRADLMIHQAREMTKQGQLRKAISHYHNVLGELERCKDYPLAQKTILSVKTTLNELRVQADQQSANAGKNKNTEKLDKEWQAFSKEDESWKKKADYDE